ncbi:hypothetical protein SLEP1_g4834 [Rubroshorea leprosula]|uniref:Helicase MOV-10-like beta-barrel domain-containing protein n=1 Tax=Rubroshorea leprosula TaxID=152421 RepID=A0AAV5HVX5_9ROSI|nr:hypothetical protein SLEP1_g4834 [Rubroshorea leprosula]
MSSVLEIFKRILGWEDKKVDNDNESSTFAYWTSSSRVQLDRTTSRNQQNFVNSSLITSTREESLPRSTPSDLPIHSRVVFPSSTGLTKGKGAERIYQEPLNPRNSSTKPNFPTPPSQTSVQFLSKLTPPPSSLKPPTSASKPSSSSFITPASFPSPGKTSSTKQHLFSPNSSSTSTKPSAAFINPQSSSPKLPSSSGPSSSSPSLFPSFKQTLGPSSAAVPNPQSSYHKPPSSSGPSSSSLLPSSKPTLVTSFAAVSNHLDKDNKGKYIQVESDSLHFYTIPDNIENLIKKDSVPELLKKPLSPSTYEDYFATLLYAEDIYVKKWSNFELLNVTLELHEAAKGKDRVISYNNGDEKDDKIYVAFEVSSSPQMRPFLLSKDIVFAQPSGRRVAPFQGVIYRVVKKTTVLVEFGEDFHSQHHETRKYDISFSFNRVSLERAHQAIAAASDPSFQKFLFPKSASRIPTSRSLLSYCHKLDLDQNSVVHQMLNFQGPPPFLVEGQFCATYSKQLSRTGQVIVEAILQIYRHCPESRVLVCAPINSTCDVLIRGLKRDIPEVDMFQASAASREIEKLPIDNLKQFPVVLSTFVNSYCLHDKGITAGHFNYIFLLDASSATEPETMVALANLADEKTAVIATGARKNHSSWFRLDIARQNGLSMSYFQRLCQSDPYRTNDPRFISHLFVHDS